MSGYTSHPNDCLMSQRPEALVCDTCLFKSMMMLSSAKRAEGVGEAAGWGLEADLDLVSGVM